jgi:hypothetical protein
LFLQNATKKAIAAHIDPRLRDISDWRHLRQCVSRHPDLLKSPIDETCLPNFLRWRYTKTYSFPEEHAGVDYHVYEDTGGRLRFVPPFTRIRPILPGVVIDCGFGVGERDDVVRNAIAVLHSFPAARQGRALASVYAHVMGEKPLCLGDVEPRMRLGLFGETTADHKEMWLQHLHFGLAYCEVDALSKLVEGEPYPNMNWISFEQAVAATLDSERVDDPWIIFPPSQPVRYAWFEDNGMLHASDEPRLSILTGYEGEKVEF